jgi:hypothetical protein
LAGSKRVVASKREEVDDEPASSSVPISSSLKPPRPEGAPAVPLSALNPRASPPIDHLSLRSQASSALLISPKEAAAVTPTAHPDPLATLPPPSLASATLHYNEDDNQADELLYQAPVPSITLTHPLHASALTKGRAGASLKVLPRPLSQGETSTQEEHDVTRSRHQTLDIKPGVYDFETEGDFEIEYDETLPQGDEVV